MSIIQISHLTFAYPGSHDNVFTDVSLQLDTKWKLGLVGRNGRGKTTLLRLLQGQYPYQGNITAGQVDFEYFPYKVENPALYCESIAYAISPEVPTWQIKKELSLLGLEEGILYMPYQILSPGERTKFLLAVLFCKPQCFLLIDEPTNHLDLQGRCLVSAYLKNKEGFILVSHDRAFLDNCIDHVLSINRADIQVQKGNFSTWQLQKDQQDAEEAAHNQRLKKEIGRLTDSARQTAQWSHQIERRKYGVQSSGLKPDRGHLGHQAAKMMQRAKSIQARQQKTIEEKTHLLRNVDAQPLISLSPLSHHAACLAEASGLTISYGAEPVCGPIHLALHSGDRLALVGPNGSGKSTLLKCLAGQSIQHAGMLRLASGLSISYLPQDVSGLHGSLSAYAQRHGLDETQFYTLLRKLGFSRSQFEIRLENFSMGQKKKTALAHSLCQQAHLYLWDEPLNYIDVISRLQIEDLILRCRPTMIFVEHDASFLKNIATDVLSF